MQLGTSSAGFGCATDIVATTATGDNNIDSLLVGTRWLKKNVSFSFTDSFPDDYEAGYPRTAIHGSSFYMFNTVQQVAARNWIGAIGEFDRVSLLNPNDITGINDRDATIRMAISNDPATAYAYYPWSSVQAGDIWIGTKYNYANPVIGTYAYYTIGHELGHALGLGHGHETGGMRDVAMNSDRDSMEFSIMTYRSYIGAPTDAVYNAQGGYAQTLMMYDIAAIQHLYGAGFDSKPVNSNYTFSTITGEMFINGIGQGVPYTNIIFRTVWDGGGIDTFDFSNYSTDLAIDLTPASWIDLNVGGDFQRANLGNGHYARAQIFNALQYNNDMRSLIENAQGGSGNDTITGNIANNIIMAGAGNDTLNGNGGADTMTGGLGNDTYFVENARNKVIEKLNEGTDSVSSKLSYLLAANIENLTLTGTRATNGTGNNLDNLIIGNDAANRLNGGAGNDILDGGWGSNKLTGGKGNDIFRFTTDGHIDTITDYNVANDTIQLENAVFTALTTTGTLAASYFAIGANALDEDDFIIYNKPIGALLYDADCNGAMAAIQIATLGSRLSLTNEDIVVI